MPKYRGSRKNYTVPNKPLSLFKITAGDSAGGGVEPPCPRNAAGQRVSEAGAGEGPLHGGPRDADGFLMKGFDDALKIVIYEDMSQGEREFAIAFMEQDTPAPPGTPNACLSKYERAIIATYNDITTAEMNGDTHINELLKREAGKPRPERLPQNPLVITGVNAGDVMGPSGSGRAPKAQTAPQGFKGNTTIARLAALEGGVAQNTSFADIAEEVDTAGLGTRLPDPLPVGVEYTFQDKPLKPPILSTRPDIGQTWDTVEAAIPTAVEEIRRLAREYYSDYDERKAENMPLPEAGVEFIRRENGQITYSHIIVGNMVNTGGPFGVRDYTPFTPANHDTMREKLAGRLHFHWTGLGISQDDVKLAPPTGAIVLGTGGKNYEAWVASYEKERRYFKVP